MRTPPPIAARQCGVFSAVQALPYGWSRAALRWAVQSGALTRLRPGVYQLTDLDEMSPFARDRWRHAGPAIAAVLMTPGAVASHSTAAILRGLPLPFLPDRPCLSVVPHHTGEIPRVHAHRCAGEMFAAPVGAISCTTVERTVIDLAREHGATAGTVALDHALREHVTTRDLVEHMLGQCYRWPGIVSARTAAAAADPRSESVLETLSRLRLGRHGIAPPELQVAIGDGNGRQVGRVDLYWDEFGVVGECDGAVKYDAATNPTALRDEKLRQEALERLGLIVVRWGWSDLRAFDAVATRLLRAFDRGRRREPSDRRWSLLR